MSADHVVHLGCGIAGMRGLADRSVDVVCTDPPYSEYVHTRSVRGKGHRAGGNIVDLGFDHLDLETMTLAAEEFGRLARRWVLVFSDVESGHKWRAALEASGLEYVRAGVWVKGCPTPQMTGDRPAIGVELLTIAHRKGRKRWNGGGRPAVWGANTAYRDGDEITHPTQKPLSLMLALLRDFSEPGELVLDPFAGSGTTGVAARLLDRRFLGWELSPEHHRTASARVAATRPQLGLWTGSA